MRRLLCAVVVLLAVTASAADALAQVLTLSEPVDLRVRPGAKRPIVATAPVGAQLTVLRDAPTWIPVSFEGGRFYATAAQLMSATPSQTPGPDPTCDYGYPYSGSGLFFARPLTQLRHSEPLGFLFGYHRFYPC